MSGDSSRVRTRVALTGERKERAGDKVVIQAVVISVWPVFNGAPFAYLEVHVAGSVLASHPVSLRVFSSFCSNLCPSDLSPRLDALALRSNAMLEQDFRW